MRTAEFTLPGHPDKVCDQISDALLDEFIKQDEESRCAIEVFGCHNTIFVGGEVTTKAWVDIPRIVNETLIEIGYNQQFSIIDSLVNQSKDIAQGVDKGGAGDQGIMIGYACKESPELMPTEYHLARKVAQEVYNSGGGPDGKTQVTTGGKESVLVVSAMHLKEWKDIAFDKTLVNPTGKFNIGGFDADTGLTGRKIVVDAYGPRIPIGGGCFSGKDPTKVDRSGAYMARKIAVDYLKKYKAEEVLIKLAYIIGIPEPVMTEAEIKATGGTLVKLDGQLKIDYDLRPQAIIEFLDLKKPIYKQTARWGHFGNGFPWDK